MRLAVARHGARRERRYGCSAGRAAFRLRPAPTFTTAEEVPAHVIPRTEVAGSGRQPQLCAPTTTPCDTCRRWRYPLWGPVPLHMPPGAGVGGTVMIDQPPEHLPQHGNSHKPKARPELRPHPSKPTPPPVEFMPKQATTRNEPSLATWPPHKRHIPSQTPGAPPLHQAGPEAFGRARPAHKKGRWWWQRWRWRWRWWKWWWW